MVTESAAVSCDVSRHRGVGQAFPDEDGSRSRFAGVPSDITETLVAAAIASIDDATPPMDDRSFRGEYALVSRCAGR